ncbi:MAG: glutathione S-transferase [Thermoplasmata archaeon]|nr:glutathione S-transferase [Thermoplasmata archaeon]
MAEPVLLRMPFSHFCRKAEWGLTQAGVAYTTLDVRLIDMADQKRANPEGTVPVLRVGDELLFGSHAVLRWAEAHKSPAAPSLYPPGTKPQVEAWESWADATLGSAVRREAYRALHAKPSLAGQHGLPLWMRTSFARRFYLGVLKLLKARRFEADDPKAIREGVSTIVSQLGRSGTGYLFGAHPTAADQATAALLEPLVPAAAERGYDRLPGWPHLVAYIARVRPATTTRSGGKAVREADWREFERLNAVAKPVAMPALRCECGVPDWTKA